jgi:PTH1 family peptidyl-tRNA hydrolase
MMNDAPWMIAGLGNPGAKYARSRHNAGFMALDRTAGIWRIPIDRHKFDSDFGRGSIDGIAAILLKPMAYMNRSGLPIRRMSGFFQIPLDHLLVIHDDIDLDFGKIKIKAKGGHGGHNGLRSIMDAVGGGEFGRLRLGIGRPEGGMGISDYVLGDFTASERRSFDPVLDKAAEAAGIILKHGINVGMNRFN